MFIPLIPKNPDLNDFTCRDGEIEFMTRLGGSDNGSDNPDSESGDAASPYVGLASITLTPAQTYPTVNIRIPLKDGDKEKGALLLNGEISRVDAETAERLTQAIVTKAAEALLDLSTDLRRQGMFILPFRIYTMTMTPDGSLSYPGPQAIALPADFPPHPEITAAGSTDDTLTLALRFPVRPHRLTVTPSPALPEGHATLTFISYPLYIPDPKEMRGSIGSVRSATGSNSTGIRFAFLSTSAIKASVAAPEKYYQLAGNERTGYRLSSKAAPTPDYSQYAEIHGYVPPFPRASMLAAGDGIDADPLDWIADWHPATDPLDTEREGYLPISLPYKHRNPGGTDPDGTSAPLWPEGIEPELIRDLAEQTGAKWILLTRPMTLANAETSRRHTKPTAIRTIRIFGLDPTKPAHAILYASDDGIRWTPLRRFDPRSKSSVLTPPRLFWRLLIMCVRHLNSSSALGVEVSTA